MYSVRSNSTLDFGLAMMRVVRSKDFLKSAKDSSAQTTPEIVNLVTDILEHISVGKMELLKQFVNTYYFNNLLMQFAYDYPDSSLDTLVSFFESQTTEGFLEYLHTLTLREVRVTEGETIDAVVKKVIEKTNGQNTEQSCMSYSTYKKVKTNLKMSQELFLTCINYFRPIYELFSDRVEAIRTPKTPYYIAQFEDPRGSQKISHLVAFGDPLIEALPRWVYLSVFSDLGIYMDVSKEKKRVSMVLGISLESLFEDRNLDHEVLKCLADPTKMEMLKIMVSQEVCAKDLVSLLKLSKSNISHHIGKLSYADLITIHVKEGNKAYYSVNTQRIKEAFERTIDILKKDR